MHVCSLIQEQVFSKHRERKKEQASNQSLSLEIPWKKLKYVYQQCFPNKKICVTRY